MVVPLPVVALLSPAAAPFAAAAAGEGTSVGLPFTFGLRALVRGARAKETVCYTTLRGEIAGRSARGAAFSFEGHKGQTPIKSEGGKRIEDHDDHLDWPLPSGR